MQAETLSQVKSCRQEIRTVDEPSYLRGPHATGTKHIDGSGLPKCNTDIVRPSAVAAAKPPPTAVRLETVEKTSDISLLRFAEFRLMLDTPAPLDA
jgi:hypothetical protein